MSLILEIIAAPPICIWTVLVYNCLDQWFQPFNHLHLSSAKMISIFKMTLTKLLLIDLVSYHFSFNISCWKWRASSSWTQSDDVGLDYPIKVFQFPLKLGHKQENDQITAKQFWLKDGFYLASFCYHTNRWASIRCDFWTHVKWP